VSLLWVTLDKRTGDYWLKLGETICSRPMEVRGWVRAPIAWRAWIPCSARQWSRAGARGVAGRAAVAYLKEGQAMMKIVLIYMLDGKLLMKPSKANVKAHLDKIREVIKANKMAKQANLIRLLNPILHGWANYHSHVE
jgi:Group II intron, maturase-specific domain